MGAESLQELEAQTSAARERPQGVTGECTDGTSPVWLSEQGWYNEHTSWQGNVDRGIPHGPTPSWRVTRANDCFKIDDPSSPGTSSHIGCPIASDQPWIHVHKSNTK